MYWDIYKLLTFWLLYELNKSDLLQGVQVLMSQNPNRGGPFQVGTNHWVCILLWTIGIGKFKWICCAKYAVGMQLIILAECSIHVELDISVYQQT